jgi:hypothetical protein
MEYIGVEPQNLYYTCHFEGTSGDGHDASGSGPKSQIKNPWEKFIKFTLIWTPESLTWYANDVKYHEYKRPSADYRVWPFDREFYLIMNLAWGGKWGGYDGVDDTKLPGKFLIDYVRVYQLQEHAGPFGISILSVKHGVVKIDPVMDAYPENTAVTVTAIPDPGYQFKLWKYQSAANPLTFTLNKNTFLSPVFFNPDELITNGDFDKTAVPWVFYVENAANSTYSTAITDSIFTVNISKSPGTDWKLGFQQMGLAVEKTSYLLKFDAWSQYSNQLLISVAKNYPNWGTYISKNVSLTTTRKKHEITLEMPVADNNVRLYFGLGRFTGKLFFDNISLTKIISGPATESTALTENNEQIAIFPNPAKQKVTIRFAGVHPGESIPFCIFSTDGKQMGYGYLLSAETDVCTSTFLNGIYFLRIIRNNKVTVQKMIIEK